MSSIAMTTAGVVPGMVLGGGVVVAWVCAFGHGRNNVMADIGYGSGKRSIPIEKDAIFFRRVFTTATVGTLVSQLGDSSYQTGVKIGIIVSVILLEAWHLASSKGNPFEGKLLAGALGACAGLAINPIMAIISGVFVITVLDLAHENTRRCG